MCPFVKVVGAIVRLPEHPAGSPGSAAKGIDKLQYDENRRSTLRRNPSRSIWVGAVSEEEPVGQAGRRG